MNGATVATTAGLIGPDPNWRVSHTGDFDGDGNSDLVWRNVNGSITMWLMSGVTVKTAKGLLGAGQSQVVPAAL